MQFICLKKLQFRISALIIHHGTLYYMHLRLILIILLTLFCGKIGHATHIRSGEITLERISNTNLTYRVTITIYRDTRTGVEIGEGGGGATFSFGDGTFISQEEFLDLFTSRNRTETRIDSETSEVKYVFVHTFPTFGIFTLRYSELARKDGILNINAGASGSFEFNIST